MVVVDGVVVGDLDVAGYDNRHVNEKYRPVRSS
jgi:hypothetical protein